MDHGLAFFLSLRRVLAGGAKFIGSATQVTPLSDRGGEHGLVALKLTGHQRPVISAIPAIAWQTAGVKHELKFAAAQRDHLRSHIAPAREVTDIFTLDLKIRGQRFVLRVRPQTWRSNGVQAEGEAKE